MANIIRVCIPANVMNLISWDGNKFTGAMAHIATALMNDVEKSSNTTAHIRSKDDGLGEMIDPSSGGYNGCLGRIQRNQSDLLAQMVEYPLQLNDVRQGNLAMDSTIRFMNYYTPASDLQVINIESFFASFQLSSWLLCLATFSLAYSILALRATMIVNYKLASMKIKTKEEAGEMYQRSKRHLVYRVLTHMTRYGEICNTGLFKKIMYLTLSLFSLLVIFYFTSMVNTQLVVAKEPFTIRSYSGLLQYQVPVMFIRGMDTIQHFKFAQNDRLERQVWDMSIAMLSEKRLTLNARVSRDEFRRGMNDFFMGKISLAFESLWSEAMLKQGCHVARKNVRRAVSDALNLDLDDQFARFPLVSEDEDAKNSLKSFVFSRHDTAPLRRVRQVCKRHLEAGLIQQMVARAKDYGIFTHFFSNQMMQNWAEAQMVEACEQNILIRPEVNEWKAISLDNMKNLFRYMMLLLWVAFFAYLAEWITFLWRGRDGRRFSWRK